MSRSHIEFIQSQNVEWSKHPSLEYLGGALKPLCVDSISGEYTALLRLEANAPPQRATIEWDEELYVLEGSLRVGDQVIPRHSYVYLSGPDRTLISGAGEPATFLYWRHRSEADSRPERTLVNAMQMPWDTKEGHAQLTHLRIARKTLRIGHDNTRTYLLGGLPHGFPADGLASLERHPHPEEMFMVSGDMWSPQGRMTRGAYFFRPPGIWHGKHWSELGFLMVMRSPTASSPITEWTPTPEPVFQDNAFAPDLPAGADVRLRRPFVGISSL